ESFGSGARRAPDRGWLGRDREEPGAVRWARLDVEPKGARIRPELARAEDPVLDQGTTNYYLGHCPNGVLDVPTYGRVTFSSVYPGIDWVVRSEAGGEVHQDFVVRPGGDPSQVKLEYHGASSIEVSEDGQAIRVRTALG